ncbi:ribonuclease HI [Sphingomonas sp. PvP055]|uniref:ribonuclease HI n=1 Tax=Sphingomonas sp. PvP055 TaxID=3156391 RepID=UPI0033916DD2
MGSRIKIYFDGGCRPNPGRMEVAVVVQGKVRIFDLGEGASMDAEWHALVAAQRVASDLGLASSTYVLLGDAAAVIAQATGGHRCRGSGAAHLAVLHEMTGGVAPPIRYIKRSQNLAGIALARRAGR